MTRALALALAVLLLPSPAPAADAPVAGPAGRLPRGVREEAKAKKEIQDLFLAFDDAGEKGDAEAAASLIDFPLLVATDGATGDGAGELWSREQWLETMAPVYDAPLKHAKITHKAQVFLASDALATVNLITTVSKDGKASVERTAAIVVRREGEWRIKARVESGWTDVVPPPPEAEEPPAPGPAARPDAKAPGPKAVEAEPSDEPKDPTPARDEAREPR